MYSHPETTEVKVSSGRIRNAIEILVTHPEYLIPEADGESRGYTPFLLEDGMAEVYDFNDLTVNNPTNTEPSIRLISRTEGRLDSLTKELCLGP